MFSYISGNNQGLKQIDPQMTVLAKKFNNYLLQQPSSIDSAVDYRPTVALLGQGREFPANWEKNRSERESCPSAPKFKPNFWFAIKKLANRSKDVNYRAHVRFQSYEFLLLKTERRRIDKLVRLSGRSAKNRGPNFSRFPGSILSFDSLLGFITVSSNRRCYCYFQLYSASFTVAKSANCAHWTSFLFIRYWEPDETYRLYDRKVFCLPRGPMTESEPTTRRLNYDWK